MEQFGLNVLQRRRAVGMSQEQLAKTARLTRHAVYRIEAGAVVVRLHTLLTLAYALGVDPVELLRGVKVDE